MGQIVVNVGSFDLTSHNGNTAYSSVRYFDIPANAGITSCVATFATHVNTGNFQGKSFSLNGAQAHPNTPWPTSGIALNPALLIAGQNAFRAAVKSQAGLSARWSIGDIFLTIDYTDVDGGGTPPPNIGTLSINKTVMTLGDTLSVSVSACDAGITRALYLMLADNSVISYIYIGWGSSANVWSVTVSEGMFATYAGDVDSLILRVYMEAAQGPTLINALAKNFTVNAPASAVPTIGAFTATRDANGVDASITNYVQNYSKVSLAMGSVAGALGSSIQSYEITGAGFSAATSSVAFGPFAQTGDITFTAKVTDTRGRTATRVVTINVLPYTPVSGVNLLAYRSDGSMGADDEGAYATIRGRRVFSSLDGQNAAVIKGRVYEKDTTAPGWTNLTDDTLTLFGSGTLSQEKGYTAEISINDKITSVMYVFQIPTSTVGLHILPGATGASFGMYATEDKFSVPWPISVPSIIIGNNAVNPNFNADMLDGLHASNSASGIPVNNGVVNANLNADMVDGLHAGDFARSAGVGYVPDFGDFVIGLAHAGSDPNLLSASFGFLYGIRFNGVIQPYMVRFAHQKMYNSELAHINFTMLGNSTIQSQHACLFTYNGVRYSGIRCRWDNPGFSLYFQGFITDMMPFLVCFRNGLTGEIYNYEVWNSLYGW